MAVLPRSLARHPLAALVLGAVCLALLWLAGGRGGGSLARASSSSSTPLPNSPTHLRYSPSNPFALSFPSQTARLFPKLLAHLRPSEPALAAALAEAQAARGGPDAEDWRVDDFEWLRGKTVLLIGDSIDRYHALHLCQFIKPETPLVPVPWPHATHSDFVSILSPSTSPSLYPAALSAEEDALASAFTRADGKPLGRGREPARSWVCKVDELDFVVFWGMVFGLDDGERTPGVEGQEGGTWGAQAEELGMGDRAYWPFGTEHFHPPLPAEARLAQLFAPLLRALGRPTVDLAQLGVGAWDLDMFRAQDDLAADRRPAASSSAASPSAAELADRPLSDERKAFVRSRLTDVLSTLLSSLPFPPSTLSHPHASPSLKPARVQVRTPPLTPQHYAHPWLLPAHRIKAYRNVVEDVVSSFALDGRVAVSPWAGLLERGEREGGRGEGGTWLDHIHPGPLPGSVLWTELLLADLKALS